LIVDLFQEGSINSEGSQLIFSTHDTNLLDQSLLRRDQIWFVEKERTYSHLYSMLEFSPRKDADLERGYLRGRFGAIPVATLPNGWRERAKGMREDKVSGQ
jgi:AAA15 family ATPase/GTPase